MTAFREDILLSIKLENADNEKQVDNLTKRIHGLTAETKELVKQNKDLAAAGKENSKEYLDNSKQIEINKQKVNENNASRKGLISTLIAEDNSIKALKVRNAELIKQRELISTSTEEGRVKIDALNAEIDKNNEVINKNVSALEKQKINIGNYASALDGVIPGLGGFVSGIERATTASKLFIGTGLGLVIGGIALALSPMIAFLTGTADGMDLVEVETAKWKATLRVMKDELAEVGKQLLDIGDGEPESKLGRFAKSLIQNNLLVQQFKLSLNLLAKAFPDVAERIDEARKVAENYTKALDDINEREQRYSLQVGVTRNEIDKLILQSKDRTKSESERIALIDKASKLEADLVKQEVGFNKERLNAEINTAKERTRLTTVAGETQIEFVDRLTEALQHLDDEQAKSLVEAFNAVNDAEQGSIKILEKLQNQRNALLDKAEEEAKKRREEDLKELKEFTEEVEKINAEVAERTIKAEDELEELRIERKISNAESLKEESDLQIELEIARRENALEQEGLLEEERQVIIEASRLKIFEILQKYSQKQTELDKKSSDAQIKIEENKQKAFLSGTAGVLGQVAGLFKKHTAAYKLAASAETVINTYAAATAAYKSAAAIPYVGFVLGPIAAGAAIAAGFANVAAINSTEIGGFIKGGLIKAFAGGGLSGTKVMAHHGTEVNRSNGDNRLVTVKTGEVILNESQQQKLGGAPTFSAIGVPGFNTGGINGSLETQAISGQLSRSSEIKQLIEKIDTLRPVLVLQDFEAASAKKDEPINRAIVV